MSQYIDLMPESSRRQLGQRRRIRQWATLFACTVGVIVVSGMLLGVWERSLRLRVDEIRQKVEFNAEQRAQALKLQTEISRLEGLLERQEKLSWAVELSDVIEVIATLAPDSVSLRSLTVTTRDKDRRRAKKDDEESYRELVIEMTGVAPDDFPLANFVGGLESHPLFSKIAVDFAKRSELRGMPARDFGVTAEVNMGNRFVFADAGEGVAP
ncbi:MAG: hypothetical protein VYC34_04055 [Planctomycetota bacterium]|nr:hypothetical protein [Planctomycetota bacterium]